LRCLNTNQGENAIEIILRGEGDFAIHDLNRCLDLYVATMQPARVGFVKKKTKTKKHVELLIARKCTFFFLKLSCFVLKTNNNTYLVTNRLIKVIVPKTTHLEEDASIALAPKT